MGIMVGCYPLASYLLRMILTWQPDLPVDYAVHVSEAISCVEALPKMSQPETAMFLVNIARYESHYDWRAVGDHGAAIGLFQVHHIFQGDDSTSMESQVKSARRHLLYSWIDCHSFNAYASGNCHNGAIAMFIRSKDAKQWLREHPLPESLQELVDKQKQMRTS